MQQKYSYHSLLYFWYSDLPLVFGPASGLIISKLGSMKPIIVGTVVSTIGFFGLVIFHSTEFLLSLNLAIISIGLSLSSVGAQNVIILSILRQNSGASLGMTTFLRIVGGSVAPHSLECLCRDTSML